MSTKTMKKGKKRNSEIKSVRDTKTASGIFQNLKQMFTMDNEPLKGNFDQDLWTFELIDPQTGELEIFWADGGMRGALKLAKVKDGDRIFIEHTGEKKIEGMGTLQTYDIFEAV